MAYSLKGDLHFAEKEYEKSANAYEAASKLDPWSFKDFSSLGKVSEILRQWVLSNHIEIINATMKKEDFDYGK